MEPQEPAEVMIVGSCILPEPKATAAYVHHPQKLKGFGLPPQQLQELKAIATERDEQRKRAMGDAEWCGLLDHAQHLFSGLHPSQLGLAHFLRHILAKHCMPLPPPRQS